MRVLGRGVPGVLGGADDEGDLQVPHHEGEVRVGAFGADEPVAVAGGEVGVEHGDDAGDFGVVAVAGGREGFGVEDVEPGWWKGFFSEAGGGGSVHYIQGGERMEGGRGELPCCLPEVGALAGGLVEGPLLELVGFWGR